MYSLSQSLTLSAGTVLGLVVRPRGTCVAIITGGGLGGGAAGTVANTCCSHHHHHHHFQPHPQALVIGSSEIRELNWGTPNGSAGGSSTSVSGSSSGTSSAAPLHQQAHYWLGPAVQPSMALPNPRCTVYEPTTDCVLFVDQYGIASLDNRNVVGLVAGNRYTQRTSGNSGDGAAEAARFHGVVALAPDGKGAVYIAEPDRIRKLDLPSRQVTTLPDSAPQAGTAWVALTYDAAAAALFAATAKAICRVDVSGGGDGGGGGGTTPRAPPASNADSGGGGGDGSDPGNGDDAAAAVAPATAATAASGGTSKEGTETGAVRLVAGDWATAGFLDGPETTARFNKITAVLAGGGRCLYILDNGNFRTMDANGSVSTALANLNASVSYITVLPNGDLLLGVAGSATVSIATGSPRLAPSSDSLGGFNATRTRRQPIPAVSELYDDLLPVTTTPPTGARVAVATAAAAVKPPAATGTSGGRSGGGGGGGGATTAAAERHPGSGGGSGGGPSSAAVDEPPHSNKATASGIVALRAGPSGAVIFGAHRSVLVKRSEYFRYLLTPGGGFADNGAAEVTLEDADPEALRWLLAYMYCGELYVPDELLRPAAVLADRLLLPAACASALQEWLLAGVTPGSVVSDLIWAERHSLAALVAQLRGYLVRHRRQADLRRLGEMAAQAPDLAAEVMQEMAMAL